MRFHRLAVAMTRLGKLLTLGALLLCLPSAAMANPKYAGIVVDAKTGKTLYASSADSYRYPASLTKIMTLYIVFEELEAGRLSLDSRLKVSKYASGRPPSKLGLKAGRTIRVKDAILALVTKSANDVATVVAENIGGSEKAFAARMTRTARALGMKKTTFRNPHGLPNSGQRTTARDMATLGRAIQEHFPQYYGYFKTRSYKYKGRTYGNHNKLLGRVKGVDGIKTGYIRASGFNLVTSVKRNGRQIVAVVMGGRTGASRNAQMTKLINRYLPKASRGKKTVPAIAKHSVAPALVIAELTNPPVPKTKPGQRPAPADSAAMVLAFGKDAKGTAAPVPAPAPAHSPQMQTAEVADKATPPPKTIPGFGDSIPVPPKLVKQRFDSTFAVATALPPVPRESPDVDLTTNSVGTTELLEAARAKIARAQDKTAIQQASSIDASGTIKVETVTIETLPAPEAGGGNAPVGSAPVKLAMASATGTPAPEEGAPAIEEAAAVVKDADRTKSKGDTVTLATSDTPDIEPGWQVQIAAAESENQAVALLKKAKQKTGGALRDRSPYTEPVESNGKMLYRARFAGFDTKTSARKACKTLKKAKFACFAIYQ